MGPNRFAQNKISDIKYKIFMFLCFYVFMFLCFVFCVPPIESSSNPGNKARLTTGRSILPPATERAPAR